MKGKILKFSADWCNPCKVLKSTLDEVMNMEEFKNIEVIELDIDDPNNSNQCIKYQVRSIPTLVLMDENETLINKIMGAIPKNNLIDILKQSYHG